MRVLVLSALFMKMPVIMRMAVPMIMRMAVAMIVRVPMLMVVVMMVRVFCRF